MARRSKLRPPGPTGSSGKAATVVGAGDGEKAAPREWKRLLAGGALLAVVTAIAYVPAMRGDFVWDDDDYVTKNACLRDLSGLGRIWFQPGAVSQYYPLSYSSFWVDYQCWKLTPAAYHIHNVLLHVATAMLLWMVLRRLGVPGAFVAAAVFALHPVHVESVGWITERKNVLSGLLAMATVLVYLRFAGVPSGGSTSTNGAERQALPRPVQEPSHSRGLSGSHR